MNDRLAELLTEEPESVGAYVDMLGDVPQAGPSTGVAQRLMRTTLVPRIYERYWRPFLGAIAKGMRGPTMADEHRFAVENLALQKGRTVLDVACGTGGFTRTFAEAVGPDGLAIGLDASRTMLDRAVTFPSHAVYLRADAVRPPLREKSLDGVCCFAALHMFSEPTVALDSFAALLKSGGRIALLTSARTPGSPNGPSTQCWARQVANACSTAAPSGTCCGRVDSAMSWSTTRASPSWSRPIRPDARRQG